MTDCDGCKHLRYDKEGNTTYCEYGYECDALDVCERFDGGLSDDDIYERERDRML